MSGKLHLDFTVSLVAIDSVFVATRTDCCVVVTCVLLHQGRGGQKKRLERFLCHLGQVTSDLAMSWCGYFSRSASLFKFFHKSFDIKTSIGQRRKSQGFTPTLGSRVEFPNIKSCFNRRSVFCFSLYNFPLIHWYLVTSRDLEN